ncbi:MAG: hypothetical protein MUC96_31330 [Myxococcaceae bacterium]|nr:hypothetical protein [Myxococcaceae bacterium]
MASLRLRAHHGLVSTRALDVLFASMLALILGHELDAVAQSEWRLLPLVVALVVGLFVTDEPRRQRVRLGFAAFMTIHVVLHATLEVPGVSSFEGTLSRTYIRGAGLLGAVALVTMLRERRRPTAGP